MTTLQKALNVYSICSLYASVQVMEAPLSPSRAVHGLWLLLFFLRLYTSFAMYIFLRDNQNKYQR